MWTSLGDKISSHEETPNFSWFSPKSSTSFSQWIPEKSFLMLLAGGKEEKNHFEICYSILFLTKSALKRNHLTRDKSDEDLLVPKWPGRMRRPTLANSSLQYEWRKYATPAHSSHPVLLKLGGRNWETLVKFIVQRLKFIKWLRPNQNAMKWFTSFHMLSLH